MYIGFSLSRLLTMAHPLAANQEEQPEETEEEEEKQMKKNHPAVCMTESGR